jgi:hypothetical protein
VGLLVAAGLLGCSGTAIRNTDPPVSTNLQKLGEAYMLATDKLKRPPRDLNELTPHLKDGGDIKSLAEPYVVVWGADYRNYELGGTPLIIAYEKSSSGGKRWVFTVDGAVHMSSEALAKAQFPPGHRPPH